MEDKNADPVVKAEEGVDPEEMSLADPTVDEVPYSSVDSVVQKMAEMASGICRLEAQLAETQVMAEVLRTMQTTLLLANQSSLRAEAEIERKAAEVERKTAEIEAYKLLILGLEDKIRTLNEHVSAFHAVGGGGSNAKGGSVEEESNDDEDGDGDGSGDGGREGKKGGKQIYTMSRSIVTVKDAWIEVNKGWPPGKDKFSARDIRAKRDPKRKFDDFKWWEKRMLLMNEIDRLAGLNGGNVGAAIDTLQTRSEKAMTVKRTPKPLNSLQNMLRKEKRTREGKRDYMPNK